MLKIIYKLQFYHFNFNVTDTEHIYEKIVATIANKYGKSYPRDVRLQIMGTTEQRTSEIACKELKLPITPQQFHIQMKELGNQMLRNAPLMKGRKNSFILLVSFQYLFIIKFIIIECQLFVLMNVCMC